MPITSTPSQATCFACDGKSDDDEWPDPRDGGGEGSEIEFGGDYRRTEDEDEPQAKLRSKDGGVEEGIEEEVHAATPVISRATRSASAST